MAVPAIEMKKATRNTSQVQKYLSPKHTQDPQTARVVKVKALNMVKRGKADTALT